MDAVSAALAQQDDTQFAIAMSNLVFGKHEALGFAAMSKAEQTAYCVDALEREVNNGGFDQFFGNSSGDTAIETIEALERIEAKAAADLVRRACAAFPNGRPASDPDARARQMDAIQDTAADLWSELDDAFYLYPDNLAALLRRYVAANRAHFGDGAT